jgi:hypothetical protein
MAEEKATLFRLNSTLAAARRYYAAGNTAKARALLQTFKGKAQGVLVAQQKEMVREMNRHLKVRGELKDLTTEAAELAKELRGEASK